jgi:hypothetical protein
MCEYTTGTVFFLMLFAHAAGLLWGYGFGQYWLMRELAFRNAMRGESGDV